MSEDASLREQESTVIPFHSALNSEEIGLLEDTPQKALPVIIQTAETIARIFAKKEMYGELDGTQDIYFELNFEGGEPQRILYFINNIREVLRRAIAHAYHTLETEIRIKSLFLQDRHNQEVIRRSNNGKRKIGFFPPQDEEDILPKPFQTTNIPIIPSLLSLEESLEIDARVQHLLESGPNIHIVCEQITEIDQESNLFYSTSLN